MFQFVQLKAPMIKALVKQIKYKNLIFHCFLIFFLTFPFHTYYASLLRRRIKSVPLTLVEETFSNKFF